jgi:alpha-beta hydrolase superfamily lysophospholipase
MSLYTHNVRDINNFVVIGHDWRNFGRSGGKHRGYISNFNELITDYEKVI